MGHPFENLDLKLPGQACNGLQRSQRQYQETSLLGPMLNIRERLEQILAQDRLAEQRAVLAPVPEADTTLSGYVSESYAHCTAARGLVQELGSNIRQDNRHVAEETQEAALQCHAQFNVTSPLTVPFWRKTCLHRDQRNSRVRQLLRHETSILRL